MTEGEIRPVLSEKLRALAKTARQDILQIMGHNTPGSTVRIIDATLRVLAIDAADAALEVANQLAVDILAKK